MQSLAFSPDGTQLVTGDGDGVAVVWDVDDRTDRPVTLEGHAGPVTRRRLQSGRAVGGDGKCTTARPGCGTSIAQLLLRSSSTTP